MGWHEIPQLYAQTCTHPTSKSISNICISTCPSIYLYIFQRNRHISQSHFIPFVKHISRNKGWTDLGGLLSLLSSCV
jgi:hypothetical protein